jgi:putative DNA primase/helicase
LSISGEYVLTVDRKFRDPLSVKLNARLVIVSNELPKLADASGALAGRFFQLLLSRSWVDREDTALFDRLRTELPGILLWAVENRRRLRDRGRFVPPRSAVGLVEDMEDLASPIKVFVRERCAVGPGQRVEVSELYREWCLWCSTTGQREAGTHATFGRDLHAAVPTAGKARLRTPEGRLHVYTGIRLRGESDPDDNPDRAGGQGGHSGHTVPPLDAGNEPAPSESPGTAS